MQSFIFKHQNKAALVVLMALLYASFSGDIWRPALKSAGFNIIPYLGSALVTLGDIVLLLALLAIVVGLKPKATLQLAGLDQPIGRPLIWAAAVFLPVIVLTVLLGVHPLVASPVNWVWPSVLGPFSEELFYRGLAVGVLIRVCGWQMWQACLVPAVFFGIAHLWQGSDLLSIAGVVAITGLGGLLFGWLFVRWHYNLWPAVLLHIGMNSFWTIFALGENAIGSEMGNMLRLAIVVMAIVLSLRMAPPKPV